LENTPIDYLDFASPVSGLGSKVGFDATNKCQGKPTGMGRPIFDVARHHQESGCYVGFLVYLVPERQHIIKRNKNIY